MKSKIRSRWYRANENPLESNASSGSNQSPFGEISPVKGETLTDDLSNASPPPTRERPQRPRGENRERGENRHYRDGERRQSGGKRRGNDRPRREGPDRKTEKTKAKERLKEIPVTVDLTRSQRAKNHQRRKASGDSFPSFSVSKPLLGS